MRDKINVSSLALSLSSRIIFSVPLTMLVAVKLAILQAAWVALTVTSGIKAHTALVGLQEEGSMGAALKASLIIHLLALYWGIQVFHNVGYVSTSSSVAAWYFERASFDRGCCCFRPVVVEGLCRSLTYAFGSICLGSLLVAILETLLALARYAQSEARKGQNLVMVVVGCCFTCFLSCLEDIMKLFNEWAFIYVAIYGTNFVTAGKAVLNLVEEQGLRHMLTGVIADRVLLLGAVLSGAVGCANSVLIVMSAGEESAVSVSAVGGFAAIACTLFGALCLSPVGAGFRCLMICFVEAPRTLQAVQPALHDAFKELQLKALADAPPTAVGVPLGEPQYQRLVAP